MCVADGEREVFGNMLAVGPQLGGLCDNRFTIGRLEKVQKAESITHLVPQPPMGWPELVE